MGWKLRVQVPDAELAKVPWSLTSFPYPDPALAPDPDREMAVATEHLYWRRSGSVAYGRTHEYPVDEAHLLCTHTELEAGPEPVKPAPKKRARK